jgi:hypothetical protein
MEDINLPYYLKYSGLTSTYDASGFNSEGDHFKGLESLKDKNAKSVARKLMGNIWEYYDIMNKLDEDNNQVDPNAKMPSKDRSRLEARAGALRGSIDAAKRGYSALGDDAKSKYEYQDASGATRNLYEELLQSDTQLSQEGVNKTIQEQSYLALLNQELGIHSKISSIRAKASAEGRELTTTENE